MDRPAGVVLRRAILSPVRHRRRVVPLDHVALLPESVTPDQGACLGIPGITVHRAVHVGGDVAGRTVLVQGAGGAVGMCAVALASRWRARDWHGALVRGGAGLLFRPIELFVNTIGFNARRRKARPRRFRHKP
jgi:hypothetical protein